MAWGLSVCLAENEKVIENSIPDFTGSVSPVYSICLTPKRVLFRFVPLKSSLCRYFMLAQIEKAFVEKRLFINYVAVRAGNKTHYFQTSDPAYWAGRINELVPGGGHLASNAERAPAPAEKGRRNAVLRILNNLRKKSAITEPELRARVQRLWS